MRGTLVLDLDGTLVDSVPDLAAALNRLMASRGLAPFTFPEVALMVGDGARVLVERAFAARGGQPDEAAQSAFLVDYTANAAVDTRAFDGATETMRRMADAGQPRHGARQPALADARTSDNADRTPGEPRATRPQRHAELALDRGDRGLEPGGPPAEPFAKIDSATGGRPHRGRAT